MKTKSGIKICILPSPKSNEPTKVKLKLLCWATLSAVTAGAGNIARQEITFTTLSYFVYDVFKRTRSPDRRGSRRYLQLVKGVEKIVGTFFFIKIVFSSRIGFVTQQRPWVRSSCCSNCINNQTSSSLHIVQHCSTSAMIGNVRRPSQQYWKFFCTLVINLRLGFWEIKHFLAVKRFDLSCSPPIS